MIRTVLGAVVVMFAVVMARRVVGAILGDGCSGATYGEGQGDGERSGYARYELHSASYRTSSGRDPKVPGPRVSGHTHTHSVRFRTARHLV
jgi:hypothetical protein